MIITVKHNFETAHRLPFLQGKCENIHGHSWGVEWMIVGEMDSDGITFEYGQLKSMLRGWVDDHLDHGAMLGVQDKLVDAFIDDGSKLFLFGQPQSSAQALLAGDFHYYDRPWPTVESVAEMLGFVANSLLGGNFCNQVKVQETAVNAAIWEAAQ